MSAIQMRLHTFSTFFLPVFLLAIPGIVHPWGPAGHRIVGVDAVAMLDPTARAAVVDLLGGNSNEIIEEACSWPDTVRNTPDWEWSAPLHYVNIPKHAEHYDRDRDCPDGMCVTEAIVKYANELTQPWRDKEELWRAFAWLCHLVGDLHQPLHAGYRDDLGGNTVKIVYRGEPDNLHQFWDRVVIRDRLLDGALWERPLSELPWRVAPENWSPAEVQQWTDESHRLVAAYAYPKNAEIDEQFAQESWLVIRQQWQKASNRLAGILNATLGEGKVSINQ